MAAVDGVLFDVDDTLCTYRRSTAELLAESFAAVGIEPFFEVDAYLSRYATYAAEHDSVAAVRSACFASIATERGRDPALGRRVADAFAAERDHSNVRKLPGVDRALARLTDRGYALGVVTNGTPESQTQKLDALELDDAFEVVVHAGSETSPKPDPAPFHRALGALDLAPDRAVHVGDSLAADVAGAQAAGLMAAWIRRDGIDPDPVPEYTLDSPGDLVDPPWR